MSNSTRSPITTHILDIAQGKAAGGVEVELDIKNGNDWKPLAAKITNVDGRVEDLLAPGTKAAAGIYKLRFKVGTYFKGESFYPYTEIVFEVKNPDEHYHVPLLISPYGYSTYRGT